MKALSIKQPYAYLIAIGVKPIENRTWKTSYRGRVLIHASAKLVKYDDEKLFFSPEQYSQIKKETCYVRLHTSAIIGSAEIVDCVINHPSIWAEKTEIPSLGDVLEDIHHFGKALKPDNIIYNWVLANPVLFANPIPAKGKLSFWDFPMTEEEYFNLEKIGNPLSKE